MKILVCGSRSINDEIFVFREIDNLIGELATEILIENSDTLNSTITIIEGGARGVDSIARKFAKAKFLSCEEYPADWNKYGKSAGYRRNVIMVEKCDYALILWDGKSKGTKHDIDLCKKMNKKYKVVKYEIKNN